MSLSINPICTILLDKYSPLWISSSIQYTSTDTTCNKNHFSNTKSSFEIWRNIQFQQRWFYTPDLSVNLKGLQKPNNFSIRCININFIFKPNTLATRTADIAYLHSLPGHSRNHHIRPGYPTLGLRNLVNGRENKLHYNPK
jgi:hypothetical protein